MRLVLGSGSRSRRQILAASGLEFSVLTADIDESAIRHEKPRALPLKLALAKANAILLTLTEPAVLITCDQVVICDGELREKPADTEEARRFLQSYASHPAETVTAVVVTDSLTRRQAHAVDMARVHFRPIPPAVIEELVTGGEVLSCAGGFMIEHPLLSPYVERIEGSEDSVRGLPLEVTLKLIRDVGDRRER